MAKKINFAEINQAASQGREVAEALIDEIISGCDLDDPPYLSDVLAHPKGGPLVQIRLGMEANSRSGKRFRWKIKVLCNEYGEPPKVGDTVTRTIREPRQIYSNLNEHTLISTGDMNTATTAGYGSDYHTVIPFLVDEKGCIECEFDDAVYFLHGYGVHGRTNRVLNGQRAKRVTDEPAKMKSGPYKGQFKHIHYWRYQEVDQEQYEALPPLDIEDTQTVETVEPAPAKRRTRSKKAS
jgi:hypothetical protein